MGAQTEQLNLKICCCYCSVPQSCPNLCNPMDCGTAGFPVLHYLVEFAQIHVHWVGDAIKPSHPLSPLLLLPSIFPSIRFLSNESTLVIRWPKYWSFSFSIGTCNEYAVLVSFRIDWFNLEVQGILESLLQHHNLKASVLQCSVFLMVVQLSHTNMATGKTIALTIQIIISKVMSLLFNMLSRFVIAFLPRNNSLLISWLQSFSAVTNCHIISHTISRREECVEKDK